MQRLIRKKSIVLFIAVIAILMLAAVAASLDSLDFNKGEPFSYVSATEETPISPDNGPDLLWLFIVVIAVYFLVMVLTLVMASPKQRRLIILALIVFAFLMGVVMWWIARQGTGTGDVFNATPTTGPRVEVVVNEVTPIPQGTPEIYEKPRISPWVSIGVTFFVLVLVAFVLWIVMRSRFNDSVSLQDIAGIAEQAAIDLQAGKDYGDAVINCYANMMVALNRQRGIQRRGNLTPAEFIAVLERSGLPSVLVRRLTSLFEGVRYGGKKATQEQVREAVDCLNGIVLAIKGES